MAASLVSLVGCGAADESASAPSASVASEELRRGELLSYACQACHTLKPGGQHQVGPNLSGVFGRAAGTVPGFDFSPALRESGIVWSPEKLDGWLANPAGFLPGTSMTFTGFQSAEDRTALIEYLITATAP